MTGRSAWQVLRRRWVLFVSVVLVCLLAGGLVTARTQRTYGATSRLFVSVVLPKDPAALAATNTFVTARVQSYVSVVTSPSVTDYVVRQLGLPMSSSALADHITADAPLNKVLINVRVEDSSAAQAAEIANAVAVRFVAVVGQLEQTETAGTSPVRLTVIQPAVPPSRPTQPRVKLNLALALLAGLLLAAGAVRLRDGFDDPVRRHDELETATGRPVVGVLPGGRRGLGGSGGAGLAGEATALLVANLDYLGVQSAPRSLAVTSVLAGEGKTHVVLELGRALSAAGERVCLVDVNLRAPALAQRLGLSAAGGFTSAVRGLQRPEETLQEVGPDLYAVGSGPQPPNPGGVLALPQAHQVVEAVSPFFRHTLLDAGSLTPQDDGLRAGALAGGVLLVVSARRRTRLRQVAGAVEALDAAGVTVLGTVLNNASDRDAKGFLHGLHADGRVDQSVHARR